MTNTPDFCMDIDHNFFPNDPGKSKFENGVYAGRR